MLIIHFITDISGIIRIYYITNRLLPNLILYLHKTFILVMAMI